MELGKKILELRKINGMSQEQLAEKLNVSRQSVSRWESGESLPDIDRLPDLGRTFQVTIDSLIMPGERKETETSETTGHRQEAIPAEKAALCKRQIRNHRILTCTFPFAVAMAVYAFLHLPYVEMFSEVNDMPQVWLAVLLLSAAAFSIRNGLKITGSYLQDHGKQETADRSVSEHEEHE